MVSRKRGTLDLAGTGAEAGHGKLVVRGGSQQAGRLLDDVKLGVPEAGQEPPHPRRVELAEALEVAAARGGDRDDHLAPVGGVVVPCEERVVDQPIYEAAHRRDRDPEVNGELRHPHPLPGSDQVHDLGL